MKKTLLYLLLLVSFGVSAQTTGTIQLVGADSVRANFGSSGIKPLLTRSQSDSRYAPLSNALLSGGSTTTNGTSTITTQAATYRINLVTYASPLRTFSSVLLAQSGKQKFMIVYAKTNNTVDTLSGAEVASDPVPPTLPANSVMVAQIQVTDVAIGNPAQPSTGGGNYIINGVSPQAADFNITGMGTAKNLKVIGSVGNDAYLNLVNNNFGTMPVPVSGINLAGAANAWGFKGINGFAGVLRTTLLTSNRIFDLPNSGVKLFTSDGAQTITSATWNGSIINQAYLGTGGGGATKFLREDNTWQTVTTGGTPGGLSGQLQYNNAGAFAGDAGLTYNGATDELTAGSFIKSGGTSSQFLKANGSVDNNTYALASSVPSIQNSLTPASSTAGASVDAVNGGLAGKIDNTSSIGSIYSANSWASLGAFTNTTTATINATKIDLSGGANTTSQTLALTPNTDLSRWSIRAVVRPTTKTSTTYGVGIGVRSTGNIVQWSNYMRLDCTNTGTSGLLYLYLGNNASPATITATALSFSANDYIELTLTRNGDYYFGTARNITTSSAQIGFVIEAPVNVNTGLLHNTGRFSVYNFGGTITLDELNVQSNEIKNAKMMVIGDSKTVGYNGSYYANGWAVKLSTLFPSFVISAGPGDGTQDVLDRMPEIIAMSPKAVILAGIGRNDLATGLTLASTQTRYQSIVTQLQAAGIAVYHINSFYETSFNLSTFSSWVTSTYSPNVIDLYTTSSQTSGFVASDGVHLSDIGQDVAFRVVSQSPLLTAKSTSNLDAYQQNPWVTFDNSIFSKYAGNTFIGARSGVAAVASPIGKLNMGTQFNSVANDPTNAKLVLFDNSGSDKYGFGVSSSNGLEYYAGTGVNKHTFWGNTTVNGTFYTTAATSIGISSANSSSLLHVSSTTKGVLLTPMTDAQFTAIGSKATGLFAFGTTSLRPLWYDGTTVRQGAYTTDVTTNNNTLSAAGTLTLTTGGFYSFNGTTTTWTLPAIAGNTGVTYWIKNRGSGAITLNSNAGGNDIYFTSAVNTITINAGDAVIIHNDSGIWNVQ